MHNAGSGHCQEEGQELVLLLEDKPFRMVSQLGLLGGSTLLGVKTIPYHPRSTEWSYRVV